MSNRGYHPPEQVLSFSDEELLELFCGFQDGIGFDEWYDGLPPQDQAWVDSLIDREAGEGYLLYSLFDNMETGGASRQGRFLLSWAGKTGCATWKAMAIQGRR